MTYIAVFSHDIILFSLDLERHLIHLKATLAKLAGAGLQL